MRKVLWLSVVALGLCTGSVRAQGMLGGYNPANQPAFSPYLNLLRPGAPTVLNYYGLVRPQLQFGSAIQGLERQEAYTSAQQSSFQQVLTLPVTGHKSAFQSHWHYFNTNGMGGGMGMMGGMGMGGMGMGGMGMGGMGMGGMGMGGMGMGGMGMGGMGMGGISAPSTGGGGGRR